MTKIFLTSDHHWFHKNIIKYCNRPFNSMEEMNCNLIEKWNSVVNQEDIVIHLGDFAFRGMAREIRPKLNGTIILIRGNHDYSIGEDDGFIIIDGTLKIGNLILSHKPLHQFEIPKGFINVFGHIHHHLAYSGMCVCVEQTNYKPIELSKIKTLSSEYDSI